MPRKGSKIPLRLQFTDGDTSKFVHAIVKDPTGTPLAGSPFTLTHTVNGLFTNYLVNMPEADFVSAQYLIYDDAGFTILNTDVGIIEELFERSFDLEAMISLQAAVQAIAGGPIGKVREDKIKKLIGDNVAVAKVGEE